MDQAGDMLLTRAARAVDQHGQIGRSDQPYVFVEPAGRVAAPFEVFGELRSGGRLRFTAAFRGFGGGLGPLCGGRFGRLADFAQQLVGIHGFGYVVRSSEFHAVHGVADLGVARHDDRRDLHTAPGEPLQQRRAVLVGQPHVAQHQSEIVRFEGFARSSDTRRRLGVETAFGEPRAQHECEGHIVVYDQNPFHTATKLSFFPILRQSPRSFPPPRRFAAAILRRSGPTGVRPAAVRRRSPRLRSSSA